MGGEPIARYTFSNVFGQEAPQDEIYDKVMSGLVTSFVNGENGLLFAYGTTGSGKL